MTHTIALEGPTVRTVGTARLVRSELRWVFRRPRNLIVLGLLGLVPIVIGVALTLAGPVTGTGSTGGPPGESLLSAAIGNALALPVGTLATMIALLLPLTAAMAAADAVAGEASHGTLRGWLVAPVTRGKLLTVKALGVAGMALAAVLLVAITAILTGLVINGTGSLITLSGTTLTLPEALGRVAIAAGWVALQLFAVGAVALAISSFTEHPLIVVVAVLAGTILFTVLGFLDALSWLHPFLLNESWATSLGAVLRDPMPLAALGDGALRASCYLVIGLSIAYARMSTKDG